MRFLQATLFSSILCMALLCGGCHSAATAPTGTTPAAPVTAQQTILQTDKLISDTANTLVHTVAALHQQGKLSDHDAHALDQYAIVVAHATEGVKDILANGQPWAAQKPQLISYFATVTAPAVAGQIDPAAQTTVASIGNLITLILQQIQGAQ